LSAAKSPAACSMNSSGTSPVQDTSEYSEAFSSALARSRAS